MPAYVNLSSPARCRYCKQDIYGPGTYWHYWDLKTHDFLCTSVQGIEHPYHPTIECGGNDEAT